MQKKPTYSPEFRKEAAKMVVESSRPIVQVARELKVNEATLGGWVKSYRDKHADDEPGAGCRTVHGCASWSGKTAS